MRCAQLWSKSWSPAGMRLSVGLLLLLLLPIAAWATDVRLVSYVAFGYSGGTADLMTDGLENRDPDAPSNSLRMELWAFTAPYMGGTDGLRLAVYDVGALGPGTMTGKIDSGPVPFTLPPDGNWYVAMLLTEFTGVSTDNDGYVVRNWIDFPDARYFGVPTSPQKVAAIEFYHAGLDHYFLTADAHEIQDLDTGVHAGWTRTGYSFEVWDGATADAGPVCRYYIPPGYGDSHFFSASPDECAIATVKFPQLIKESDAAFYIALPDLDTGACATGEQPVYRLWNGRSDSNHRYTSSPSIKAMMVSSGYVAEGYGPDQVDMCTPAESAAAFSDARPAD
jgi:hypothetical protein